ncbi:MAG TPA: ABC transporter permease [Symbiobacteriaceae bacterium]|jgi:putative ABC transport system permease protein|nr:ABC transporter permease [Symbiobacteriaceae bacterium]
MIFTFVESIRVAWLGIAGNKLRTVLTMLGVIIGVSAVIALVSIGQGAQVQATSQITALGSNLITVTARGNAYRIEEKDLPELRRIAPGILYAMPSVVAGQQTVKAGGDPVQVDIEGANADYPAVRERGVSQGAWFTEADVSSRRRVAVLGPTTVTNLFGEGANPLGQTIRVLGQSFTVVGVAESKGTGMGGDQDDRIFVPYTALSRLIGLNRIQSLILKTRSADDSAVIVQQVTDYYVAKFRNPDGVRVQSQDQLLETVSSMTQIFTLLLGAIASISLAVGGIGIMNIMLVSVSERTREIGIRKAIGAKKRDILLQFLIEALILSVTGGLIGILLGSLGARGISSVLGFPAVVTSSAVMLSFTFSLAVGVIFGFYPAVRASNLDPIEALRRD